MQIKSKGIQLSFIKTSTEGSGFKPFVLSPGIHLVNFKNNEELKNIIRLITKASSQLNEGAKVARRILIFDALDLILDENDVSNIFYEPDCVRVGYRGASRVIRPSCTSCKKRHNSCWGYPLYEFDMNVVFLSREGLVRVTSCDDVEKAKDLKL